MRGPLRLALLGPTASGKSAVAMELARRLDTHILSCDSMQLYREMDVGTAKPSIAERREIPHHLIDLLDIGEPCNAHRYCELAHAELASMPPETPALLVGGSGLYAHALLYGRRLLPADPATARDVWAQVTAGGLDDLIRELATVSPTLADKVRGNPRRVARAVEILRITGKAMDDPELTGKNPAAGEPEEGTPLPGWIQVVLLPERSVHREWIRHRTGIMLRQGWIDEAGRLIAKGLLETPTARQALGYAEIGRFLRGEIRTEAELAELLAVKTSQYARRQRTWFRHQHPGAVTLEFSAPDATAVADRIEAVLESISATAASAGRSP